MSVWTALLWSPANILMGWIASYWYYKRKAERERALWKENFS